MEQALIPFAACDSILAQGADLVFAPSPHEMHPDHSALAMATIEAMRRIGTGLRLALYEKTRVGHAR